MHRSVPAEVFPALLQLDMSSLAATGLKTQPSCCSAAVALSPSPSHADHMQVASSAVAAGSHCRGNVALDREFFGLLQLGSLSPGWLRAGDHSHHADVLFLCPPHTPTLPLLSGHRLHPSS